MNGDTDLSSIDIYIGTITKLLKVYDMGKDYDTIIVNFNSLLNILTHSKVVECLSEDDNLEMFLIHIDMAITGLIKRFKRRLCFVYSTDRSIVCNYIPDYKKAYLEMYNTNIYTNKVLIKYLKLIHVVKKKHVNMIGLIDTGTIEPSVVTCHIMDRFKEKKILLISRDYHDFLLTEFDIDIFDSNTLIEGSTKFIHHASKKLPNIHPILLKYYYRIRGVPRLGYTGIHMHGEKRTLKYIQDHTIDLLDGSDSLISDKDVELKGFNIKYLRDTYLNKDKALLKKINEELRILL